MSRVTESIIPRLRSGGSVSDASKDCADVGKLYHTGPIYNMHCMHDDGMRWYARDSKRYMR